MAKAAYSSSNTLDHKHAKSDGQAASGFGERIRARASEIGLSQAELARRSGLNKQTVAGYWNGERFCDAPRLFALSEALRTSAEWLATGSTRPSSVLAADDVDWLEISEYDLARIDDHGLGEPVRTTLIRRDWLYGLISDTSGIWATRLPLGFAPDGLPPDILVFCKSVAEGERPLERGIYLWRVNGGVFPRRFSNRGAAATAAAGDPIGEEYVTPADIGTDDGQHVPVARIIGAIARPI